MLQTEGASKISDCFLEFNARLTRVILNYQSTIHEVRQMVKYYMLARDEYNSAIFWLYATLIFMWNVTYYPLKFITYKLEYVSQSRVKRLRMNRSKNIRNYHIQKEFTRWIYKQLQAWIGMLSYFEPITPGPAPEYIVLTTVPNIYQTGAAQYLLIQIQWQANAIILLMLTYAIRCNHSLSNHH